MNMKEHILEALREQFNAWEKQLRSLSEEQIHAPLLPSDWSTKDVMAHLWAWQQRSIARMEAARLNKKPEYPKWPAELDLESESGTEQTNAWIYATNHDLPWPTVHRKWKDGFLQFLKSGESIPEISLLDSGRYPWMKGYPLANSLLASYDHHQEHLEKLQAWLKEHGK